MLGIMSLKKGNVHVAYYLFKEIGHLRVPVEPSLDLRQNDITHVSFPQNLKGAEKPPRAVEPTKHHIA